MLTRWEGGWGQLPDDRQGRPISRSSGMGSIVLFLVVQAIAPSASAAPWSSQPHEEKLPVGIAMTWKTDTVSYVLLVFPIREALEGNCFSYATAASNTLVLW